MAIYWPSTVPISYESGDKKAPRLYTTTFGDGYEQRTPANLNPAPRQGTIKVDQPRPVIDIIEQFLESTLGYLPFWFTPIPGTPPYLSGGPPSSLPNQPPPYYGRRPPFNPPGIFVADQGWTITEKGYNYAMLEVAIREVFEIT